jgi:hypothetical protein
LKLLIEIGASEVSTKSQKMDPALQKAERTHNNRAIDYFVEIIEVSNDERTTSSIDSELAYFASRVSTES